MLYHPTFILNSFLLVVQVMAKKMKRIEDNFIVD